MTDQNVNNQEIDKADDDQDNGGGDPKYASFDEYLKGLPDDVRTLYDEHVSGLKSALDKERDARKIADKERKDQEREKAKQERAKLESEGKYQEIIKDLETRLADLEPANETLATTNDKVLKELEAYKAVVSSQVEAMSEGLPAHVLMLVEKLEPIERLSYLVENAKSLRPKGTPKTPEPDDDKHLTDSERRERSFSLKNL